MPVPQMVAATVLAALVAVVPPVAALPPDIQAATPVAAGLNGPEGIAFLADGTFVVGAVDGTLRRYRVDGSFTQLADLGENLAGISVGRDGKVLACAFSAGRVWSVDPTTGAATVVASGIVGANVALDSRRGQRWVSVSNAGTIVDIARGTPVTVASGLSFPNGIAQRGDRYLYVAETSASRVSRLPVLVDGTLGPREVYATGLTAIDGIAFDHRGNLLAVGADTLFVVVRATGEVRVLSTDPLLNWPANIAFGRGRGRDKRDLFFANFGLPLGSGSTIVKARYSNRGARLIY